MLKTISNLGKTLSKTEQKTIEGGGWPANQKDCVLCGGNWFAPFCELPSNSVCL